ncbi:MAG: heavy metal translocating P-type ATPase [Lachnospirales bacterium]
MNYTIVCNQPNRLRIRFGKYIFTKEQCYGLCDMLLSFDDIYSVDANVKNGSLLVEYKTTNAKNKVLDYFANLKICDIVKGKPNEEQRNQELEYEFKKRVVYTTTKHFLRQIFIPTSVSKYLIWYRALPFLKEGFNSLCEGRMDVELLDATAIGASLLSSNHSTASSTMFLLNISGYLLEYSNLRAKNALEQSLAINVERVWLVKDNVEIDIPIAKLRKGDVIRVRKGSIIPVDGTIVNGDALLNESTMTGEPLPVHKDIDGTVFAGTILEDGEIDILVLEIGEKSRISKILQLIENGEETKASIQGKAERMADGIVPISFATFFGTLAFTGNMQRALSVLMVDFSCAIKLTTPITIISSLKEGAGKQIVVKGGKYLELLSKVDTVVFDKTGTLTNAVPKVSKIIVMNDNYNEDKVLRISACLEEHFPHSVAAAIVSAAKEKDLVHPEDHEKVEYIVAHGIASSYKGARSIIGSKHFIFEDESIPYPEDKKEWLEKEIGIDSAVYLAVDGELVGVVCVSDPPRDDAKETVTLLRQEGIKDIIMITGDGQGTAKYISELIGLDKYYSSVLPDGKAEIINDLKAKGKTVLMVGDGINDAPALSQADVSLTMRGSSDIAREVADVSVLSDDLIKIVVARKLAKASMDKLYKHYHYNVYFNTTLMGLGVFGIVPATTSAWLHNAFTVFIAGISTQSVLKDQK